MTAADPEPAIGPDHGCHCICWCLHPAATGEACLRSGQVLVTVQASWAGKTFPAKIPVCRPCADALNAADHDADPDEAIQTRARPPGEQSI